MLEVIHCLPEQGDVTKITVLILEEYTTQEKKVSELITFKSPQICYTVD